MHRPSPVIIIGAAPRDEILMRAQLDGVAEVIGSEEDPSKGLQLVRDAGSAIALLHLDGARDVMLALVKDVSRTGGCAPVMVSRDRDPDTILMAMRAGARDFAYLDEADADIRRAVLSIDRLEEATGGTTGEIVALFGAKGGCGATTLATNLGGALLGAKPDARVVIVDLDVEMGDVPVFLDLESSYTFSDVLSNLHRFDDDLLHRSLTAHGSGLRVLAQKSVEDDSDELDGKGLKSVLSLLRRHYDHIIVDGLSDFRELSLVALDNADRVGLVITPDVPALKNAYRCLGLFKKLGYGADKVKVVLNRLNDKGVGAGAAADVLEHPINATVSNDFSTVISAVNQGLLLSTAAPRARVTRDMSALLPLFCSGIEPDEKPRPSFFRRFKR